MVSYYSLISKISVVRILITGAAGQLGQAIYANLKTASNKIILTDNRIPEYSFDCQFIKADLRIEDQISKLWSSIENIDTLINNAGVGVFTPTLERTYRRISFRY